MDKKHCYVCGMVDPTYICDRCEHARYCSEKCQRDDWTKALHAHECYDVNTSDVDELVGELVMDLAAPLPSTTLHEDERAFAELIIDARDADEARDWLRENRMNAHVAAYDSHILHDDCDSVAQYVGLDVGHGMDTANIIGQAIARDYAERVEHIEGLRDLWQQGKEKYKDWRQQRKEAKANKYRTRQQGNWDEADRKSTFYEESATAEKGKRKDMKWYNFLKKRKSRKKEKKYFKKFGRSAAKRSKAKSRMDSGYGRDRYSRDDDYW